MILRDVAGDCAKLGFTIERSEVVGALTELVQDGLAKAYLLSSTQPSKELQDMPPLDAVEEDFRTYFYITKRGLDLHLRDDTW